MKKILIAFVVILLLGAGAVYFLRVKGAEETVVSSESNAEAERQKHIYLKLEPITATIFRQEQPAGTYTAAVTLEIADEGSRTKILEVRRRLRDTMFRELHAMFEREEYTGRKVSVDAVKERMLIVAQRELGKDVVLDVFINTLSRRGA